MTTLRRTVALTDELLRAYSRRGNFHSDPEAAAALGFERLVAQGMQVAGPAYGVLLDEWGEAFLAHGAVELTFLAPVFGGDTVSATVEIEHDGDEASISVTVPGSERPAVVGRARRHG